MNSEHYKGQKLLSSLASLEKLTNTTASSFSASDKSNEETTGTPHSFLQDLKSNCGPVDPRLEWGLSQLPSTLLSMESFEMENQMSRPLQCKKTHLNGRWSALRKPRKRLSSSSKELLERIFLVKQSPNRRERELIAGKCGVTPLQIRVWFTNKRMRGKRQ